MLVDACLNGDTTAFDALVEKYRGPLYSAAYRITGSRDDALEATQSAFVKAYENLGRFQPRFKFFSWIYRIGINESLNLTRRRVRTAEIPLDLPDTAVSPETAASQAETSRALRRALQRLSDDHRVAIVLRHLQGLSYLEIAETLDIPVKTVKSRLFEARRRLRRLLRTREPGGPPRE